jgi:hypothetical protein
VTAALPFGVLSLKSRDAIDRREAAPPTLDLLRAQLLIYEELRAIGALASRSSAGAAALFVEASSSDPDVRGLAQLHSLLVAHPAASQAAFAALVAEGRRFAATERGRQWQDAFAASPLMARLRRIFEEVSLNMFEEDGTTVLPSTYVEMLAQALDATQLPRLIARWRETL